MIELGLSRITRLLSHTAQPWKAIHVAGTNGKGSVCAYTSAMLHASNIRCGRFTSPHLIDRWDCITIDEQTVSPALFFEVEESVKAKSQRDGIEASEFEVLTATAFQVFNREKVEVGVVEVGLGGIDDATNVLKNPAVTVITKIGEDHQALLGDGLEAIAEKKAGIMKMETPVVVDGSNSPKVLEVFEREARRCHAELRKIPQDFPVVDDELQIYLGSHDLEEHQKMHIHLAYQAARSTLSAMNRSVRPHALVHGIEATIWPGRLQFLDLRRLNQHEGTALLDGAHNIQSANILASFVDVKLRSGTAPITWIVGISEGKDAQALLSTLLRSGDNIVAAPFRRVDGMPWVHPMNSSNIVEVAQLMCQNLRSTVACQDLENALQIAADRASGNPIVIAGSLYLISDVLRSIRSVPA